MTSLKNLHFEQYDGEFNSKLSFLRYDIIGFNERCIFLLKFSEIETPFGKRILIKKRKIKEQMKIILAQYFEIIQISSSGKIYNKI